MSLITKNQLEIVIQVFKNLLSFKADKADIDDVKMMINEVSIKETSDDAMFLAIEMNYIDPIVNENGLFFTDDSGKIYSL